MLGGFIRFLIHVLGAHYNFLVNATFDSRLKEKITILMLNCTIIIDPCVHFGAA